MELTASGMIDFLRMRRCRFPLAVILLLVTQLAFAGQSCRAVMFDMNRVNEAPARQHMAPAGNLLVAADGAPCCDGDAPPPKMCLVAVDAATATAIVAGRAPLHDLASPVQFVAAREVLARSWTTPTRPAGSVGPPLPAYIVFSRFLS